MRTALRSVIAVACVAAAPLAAQDSRANLVVTSQWLSQHIHDANLVLLHVGDKGDYDKAHIPGARFIDFHDTHYMQDPATKLTLEMLPADTLRAHLAKLGISDNSRIVVYYGQDWVSPATRIVLTLDYAGLGRSTSLLDGGMGAWTKAGNSTATDVPVDKTGSLSPLTTKPVTVTADYVRDNIGKPGFAVVDGRAAVYYDGVEEGGPKDARKKGHIKGALSVPFTSITNDNLELKSADELTSIFRAAGVKPGDTIIGYCHIGQQATAMLFGARTLGYKVLLFDGSFEDWARRGWPVEVSGKDNK